ncbi:adenosine deaminase [Homoserinimonas sp. OAct 916]|uniref:adenosine deaminase n=1 Tax=Homoserinimonas sp. OAct 916 TaxID=2211450 RepID=UPI000DBE9511|nr:adenosine deaminase [Homoserinimonas sp. OAct 916]
MPAPAPAVEEDVVALTDVNYLLASGASIRDLPKISLHDHLDGGLRPQTIIELADGVGYELPETEPQALAGWFAERSDSGSLLEYLKTFEVTCAVMQTREGLVRCAREYVNDLVADGVIYGEVRWAPEQHLERGLSLDDAVHAVQEGIDEGVDDAAHLGRDIRVGQLLSAMRQGDRARDIAELAVRHRLDGVVGFDVAGPEDGFPASLMAGTFDYLALQYLPVTVHAGEAAGIDSIRSALFDGRALRLGHGVRIAEDMEVDSEDADTMYVTVGPVAQWVKDRRIALELSPTSNLQTGAIAAWGSEIEKHPFDLLYQLGFAVTVNTDNRLMSNTTLSRELSILADAFSYDVSDLEVFQQNAAAAAFLPLEDREELADQIAHGFDQGLDAGD